MVFIQASSGGSRASQKETYRTGCLNTNCLPPLSARRKRLFPIPGEPAFRTTAKARTHYPGPGLRACDSSAVERVAVELARLVDVLAVVLEVVADVHVDEVLEVVGARDRRLGRRVDRHGDVGGGTEQCGDRRRGGGRLGDRVVRGLGGGHAL